MLPSSCDVLYLHIGILLYLVNYIMCTVIYLGRSKDDDPGACPSEATFLCRLIFQNILKIFIGLATLLSND